jgi:hypothetical protein
VVVPVLQLHPSVSAATPGYAGASDGDDGDGVVDEEYYYSYVVVAVVELQKTRATGRVLEVAGMTRRTRQTKPRRGVMARSLRRVKLRKELM